MELIEFKQMKHYDIIEYEYEWLCGRGDARISPFLIPFVGDLNDETFQAVVLKTEDEEVAAAIFRGDHELYGMDKQTFMQEAQAGRIAAFNDLVLQKDINSAVYLYLSHCRVSHYDYFHDVVNAPVRSVW